MKEQLSPADLKRLQKILEVGHELERLWVEADRVAERAVALDQLQRLIASLENPASGNPQDSAEAEALKRLAFHARNLTPNMTAKHLAVILVPFERLRGKALRDDEFLVDEGDLKENESATGPLRVIADNLRSAFNVGSLLRTADCFGVEEVILSGYTPTPDETKTAKTSLGAQNSVTWSSQPLDEAIERARDEGYEIVALETVSTATPLSEFVWPEKAVLLLGNERFGLDDATMQQAQHFVRIPLFGRKNSLNVGIAAGVALADWREKYEQAVAPRKKEAALTYKPIGTFRAASVHKYEAPRQGVVNRSEQEGIVHLGSAYKPALKDLEGFERLWLVYDFHHNKSWKPLVLPPRGPHEKRGVFATRSPYRPNSIGLSAVELVRIEDSKLIVRCHDLLDETPILDVKPYIPYADAFPSSRIGWLDGVEETKHDVTFTSEANEKLEWLEENGVDQLRGFIVTQLEFDPTDSVRKRVSAATEAGSFSLAYRTWRVDFTLDNTTVVVTQIRSGYMKADLANSEDKYGDHNVHRRFNDRFQSLKTV